MKKLMISLSLILLVIGTVCIATSVKADPPPPPIQGGHGATGNQDPVGAPIDGGLGILVILAGSAGYGGLKLYRARKKEKLAEENIEN
jgi:hypothetical protein